MGKLNSDVNPDKKASKGCVIAFAIFIILVFTLIMGCVVWAANSKYDYCEDTSFREETEKYGIESGLYYLDRCVPDV